MTPGDAFSNPETHTVLVRMGLPVGAGQVTEEAGLG